MTGRWVVRRPAIGFDAGAGRAEARWSGGAGVEGLPAIFSADAVLVGHSWFRLAAKGTSRFTFARIEHDVVPSVEFS